MDNIIVDLSLEKEDKLLNEILNQIDNDVEYKMSKVNKLTVRSDEAPRINESGLLRNSKIIHIDVTDFEKLASSETFVKNK